VSEALESGSSPLGRPASPGGRGVWATAAVAATLAAGAALTACGSTSHQTTTATSIAATTPPTTTVPSTTLPTPPSSTQVSAAPVGIPTVPDCGGGAYKPATLLIVCGNNTTMATNVTWGAWTASTAAGSGTVHLVEGATSATAPGRLSLSDVVTGPIGPQFTLLTVTWIGPSPDGKATDTFRLAEVP